MKRQELQDGSGGQELTIDDLMRRQSVRATFRLPQEVIDLLGVLAGQLGIKQKSLLDQLVEDREALQHLAREADEIADGTDVRRQKTFVLSRSSLQSINYVARKQKIPRDLVVEVSIRRLLPLIENELKKHNKRKILFKEMQEFQRQGEKLRQKAHELFGDDDTLYRMIDNQLTVIEKNLSVVASIIDKGMAMEEW